MLNVRELLLLIEVVADSEWRYRLGPAHAGAADQALLQHELNTPVIAQMHGAAAGADEARRLRLINRVLPAAELEAEAQAFDACAHSAELREGIAAFLAKRKPQFSGQ